MKICINITDKNNCSFTVIDTAVVNPAILKYNVQ